MSRAFYGSRPDFFLFPVWNLEKKNLRLCAGSIIAFAERPLLFVSLVRYITFIYKVKLISTGQKISRKDQKGARKEKERER